MNLDRRSVKVAVAFALSALITAVAFGVGLEPLLVIPISAAAAMALGAWYRRAKPGS